MHQDLAYRIVKDALRPQRSISPNTNNCQREATVIEDARELAVEIAHFMVRGGASAQQLAPTIVVAG